jgi:anti-anti-sigma factor
MSLLARVVDEQFGQLAVASVEGEVDASNTGDLGERLRAALTNRSIALIVDLTGTTYLDSAGITLLFALDAELHERRQRLHLVVPAGAPIARMLAIVGLDGAVPVHATRADAIEHAAAGDG